jgi:WhiB family transcriptional regulator, redox-sensing transcriptional regulator
MRPDFSMTAQETMWPRQRRRPRPRSEDDLPTARLLTHGYWRVLAACQSIDPELFFPVSASGKSLEQVTAAKAVCAACPVRRECLAFALRTSQVHGIWGGLTEEERHQAMPREVRKPACAAGLPAPGKGARRSVGDEEDVRREVRG